MSTDATQTPAQESATTTAPVTETSSVASTPSTPQAAAPSESAKVTLDGLRKAKDASAPGSKPAADAAVTPSVEQKPTFTPNFKFKVMDEEKEIEEIYRGLIKDADTEKKVRELHERAYGHAHLKPKYEQIKSTYEEVNNKFTTQTKALNQLSSFINNKDFGSFIQMAGIPKDLVFDYVISEYQKTQATPEQRAQMEQAEVDRRSRVLLEQQVQELQNRVHSSETQSMEQVLSTTLARADVQPVASYVDAIYGSGAFRREVIRQGRLAEVEGRELSVPQVVSEAVAFWSKSMSQAGQAGIPQQGMPAATIPQAIQPQTQQAPPPTLPNVGSRSTSPIKRGPKNLEELKKMSAAAVSN